MMKQLLSMSVAAAAMLALAACNNNKGDEANPGQSEAVNAVQDVAGAATGVATGAVGAVSTDAFVRDAAMGDMYEIESSRMALEKSQNAQVKKAAQMIIKDHEASSAKLKQMAAAKGWTLPTELDERRKGFLDNLRAASAADFDDRYLDQQTAAHHEALLAFNGYREAGQDAELKAFAAETAPRLEAHANMVTSLDREGPADDEAGANAAKK